MGSQALDHAAKQMGFRDFATYQAYQAQQRAMQQAPVAAAPVAPAAPAQAQPAPENWLQRLLGATPLGGAMARVRRALP
jgi:hypothetical protein